MVKKTPDEPIIRERNLITYKEYYGRKHFMQDFFLSVAKSLSHYYSPEYYKKISPCLKDKRIEILNPELFFHYIFPVEAFDYFAFKQASSLKVYMQKLIMELKKILNYGASYIPLYSLFINLAFVLEEEINTIEEVRECIDTLLLVISDMERKNPICIRIFDSNTLSKISNVSFKYYKEVINIYLQSYYKQVIQVKSGYLRSPSFEVIKSVFHSVEELYIQYLYLVFGLPTENIREFVYSFNSVDPTSSELLVGLEILKSKSPCKDVNLDEVIQELIKLKENTFYTQYKEQEPWENYISNYFKKLGKRDTFRMKTIYTDSRFFLEHTPLASSTFIINCKDEPTISQLDEYIEMCLCINNTRNKSFMKQRVKPVGTKIILKDVQTPSSILTSFLQSKEIEIFNRNFNTVNFEINYYPNIFKKSKFFTPEKTDSFYLSSDSHFNPSKIKKSSILVNKYTKYFNIFCGDASDNPQESVNWLKNSLKYGVFTNGESFSLNSNSTLQDNINLLRKEFPLNSPLKYLNNNCVEINGVIFIGSCLYTDFNCSPDLDKEEVLKYIRKNMPEFSCTTVNSINGTTRLLDPLDYIDYFNNSISYIQEKLIEHLHDQVVIVSHFAPFPYSYEERKFIKNTYKTPYYCNNLSELFKKFKNIRMWCHGHIHNGTRYVYKNTLVVSSPLNTKEDLKLIRGFVRPFEYLKNNEPWENLIASHTTFYK